MTQNKWLCEKHNRIGFGNCPLCVDEPILTTATSIGDDHPLTRVHVEIGEDRSITFTPKPERINMDELQKPKVKVYCGECIWKYETIPLRCKLLTETKQYPNGKYLTSHLACSEANGTNNCPMFYPKTWTKIKLWWKGVRK